MEYANNAFDKGVDSLFVVGTPFQALCAVEAMLDLEIKHYQLIVMVFPRNSRLKQTCTILDLFGVKYSIYEISVLSGFLFLVRSLITKKKYKRVFLGDYYVMDPMCYALQVLKNNSNVVYLDDGNLTVSVFNGVKSRGGWIFDLKRVMVKTVTSFKKIEAFKYFYSLYYDLAKPPHIAIENNLSHLKCGFTNVSNEGINTLYFIGTFNKGLASDKSISYDNMKSILFETLVELQHSYQDITYIPHGRDTDIEISSFCKEHGINYVRTEVCIELYLLNSGIIIYNATSFTSSALLSVRKMYPDADVFNYSLKGYSRDVYNDVEDYYKKHGIKNIEIDITKYINND